MGFLDKLFDKSSDQQQVGKDFYEAIKNRRSIYAIDKNVKISEEKICFEYSKRKASSLAWGSLPCPQVDLFKSTLQG